MNLNTLFQGIFPDSLSKVENNAFLLGNLSKDKSFESFFSSAINSFNNNPINYSNPLINPLTQNDSDISKIESYFNFSSVEPKDLSLLILNYIENAIKYQYTNTGDQTTTLDPQSFSTEITDRIKSFLTENLKKLNLTEEEINRIMSDVETIANQIIPLITNTLIIDNIPQYENQDSLLSNSDLASNEPKGKTIADIKSFSGGKISQDKTTNTIAFDQIPFNKLEQLVDFQTINSNNYGKNKLSQNKVNSSLNSQTEEILSSAKEIQITRKVFNFSELSSEKENVSNKPQSDDFNLSNIVQKDGEKIVSLDTKKIITTNSKVSIPNLTQPPLQEEGVRILESIHASGFDKGMFAKGNIPLSSPINNESAKSEGLNVFMSPEVNNSSETVGKPIQAINDIGIIPINANSKDKAAVTNVPNNADNDNTENTGISNSAITANKMQGEKGSPQIVTNTTAKAENVNPKAVENPLGQAQSNLLVNTSIILDRNKLQIEPANNDKLIGNTQTIIPNPQSLSSQSPVSSPQPQDSIDIINQIINNLQNYNIRIEDKIKIKLEPDSLGHIELELTVKNGKSAILNITTDTNSVKEAIQQNISQLKEGFNKLNINVESFNVNVNAQNQNNHHQLSQSPLPVVNNFTSVIDTPDKQNDIPKEGNVKITHNGRLHIII